MNGTADSRLSNAPRLLRDSAGCGGNTPGAAKKNVFGQFEQTPAKEYLNVIFKNSECVCRCMFSALRVRSSFVLIQSLFTCNFACRFSRCSMTRFVIFGGIANYTRQRFIETSFISQSRSRVHSRLMNVITLALFIVK